MGIWQIIYIALTAMGLGIVLVKHGEPRTDKYNIFVSLTSTVIVLIILFLGGFFS